MAQRCVLGECATVFCEWIAHEINKSELIDRVVFSLAPCDKNKRASESEKAMAANITQESRLCAVTALESRLLRIYKHTHESRLNAHRESSLVTTGYCWRLVLICSGLFPRTPMSAFMLGEQSAFVEAWRCTS